MGKVATDVCHKALHGLKGHEFALRHVPDVGALDQHVVDLPLLFDREGQVTGTRLALTQEEAVVGGQSEASLGLLSGYGPMAVHTYTTWLNHFTSI